MHSRKKSSKAAESMSPEAADVWIEGRDECKELEAPELLLEGGGGDPTAKAPPPPPTPPPAPAAATRAASGGLIEWMSSSAAVPPALPVLRCFILLVLFWVGDLERGMRTRGGEGTEGKKRVKF